MHMDSIPILSLITYTPLAGAIILLFWTSVQPSSARMVAIVFSAITFVLSLGMLASFETGTSSMQFTENVDWLSEVGASYSMGVDGVSVLLVVLTTLLGLLGVIASNTINKRVREYYITLLVLEAGMIGVFFALDLFLFYIFWEVMLVPMALLIGIWGSDNRVYAAVKFFLYTLAGSLLMLVGIVATYWQYFEQTGERTLNIVQLQTIDYPHTFALWVFAAFFIAFAIKVPMWPFHTWLPDAHVEAPTIGSVILAGVLLKMGGYGMIRFNLGLFPEASKDWAPYIIAISVVGMLYGALVALVQPDLKKLIAYSSVSHMAFVTMGIFAFNMQGMYGAMIVMLSHGFVTGALFLCVGVIYERAHTRQITAFGGIASRMPIYTGLFGVFMLASLGLPGLSGFVGEFLALLGGFLAYKWAGVLGMIVVIFAAWYMMWMFQRVVFERAAGEPPDPMDNATLPAVSGASDEAAAINDHHASTDGEYPVNEYGVPMWPDVSRIELLSLVPLLILTVVLGVYPQPFMEVMQATLETILIPFGSQGV